MNGIVLIIEASTSRIYTPTLNVSETASPRIIASPKLLMIMKSLEEFVERVLLLVMEPTMVTIFQLQKMHVNTLQMKTDISLQQREFSVRILSNL